MVQQFDLGDNVRVDIPDKTDPDFDDFHGKYGVIDEIIEDDAGDETGDERDSKLYRVEFDDGKIMDFRWKDLRPR
ncbi:hypothetical protein EA472_12945 [Natrarchaeobius oligotrophus]|uniref:DUF8139 domain-containing protein n=2 Tax=Natrarchaeobius TaxID=2501796 RepID=A0A3N6MBW6_NATCH|nr:hypothetical protein EA472_12945 [Natrarchaeobius chitinivorans]